MKKYIRYEGMKCLAFSGYKCRAISLSLSLCVKRYILSVNPIFKTIVLLWTQKSNLKCKSEQWIFFWLSQIAPRNSDCIGPTGGIIAVELASPTEKLPRAVHQPWVGTERSSCSGVASHTGKDREQWSSRSPQGQHKEVGVCRLEAEAGSMVIRRRCQHRRPGAGGAFHSSVYQKKIPSVGLRSLFCKMN